MLPQIRNKDKSNTRCNWNHLRSNLDLLPKMAWIFAHGLSSIFAELLPTFFCFALLFKTEHQRVKSAPFASWQKLNAPLIILCFCRQSSECNIAGFFSLLNILSCTVGCQKQPFSCKVIPSRNWSAFHISQTKLLTMQ